MIATPEKPTIRFWKPKSKPQGIKRVTVVRQLGGAGDALMVSPVFLGLKEKYGKDCHITVATDSHYLGGCLPHLFRHMAHIDEVVRVNPFEFVCSPTRWVRESYRNTPNHIIPYCITHTDLVIDLNVVCALTETAQQPAVTKHRTDIWCEAAGVNPSCKRPSLILTNEELEFGRTWCDEKLGEGLRVGVVLSAADPRRTWSHAGAFAHELARRGYKVTTIDLLQIVDGITPMIGMPIIKLAAAIAHLDAVVSPDTGILHVAGALGVPVLGVFGPTDPELRMREYAGSYVNPQAIVDCSPCWYLYGCTKKNPKHKDRWFPCLNKLTPQFALHELEAMLRRFGKTLS